MKYSSNRSDTYYQKLQDATRAPIREYMTYAKISKIKALKLLPWIAHKNGIIDQLALNLWRHAAGEAEETSGCCNSSDYYGLAVSRFFELADQEGEKCAQRDPPDCLAIPDACCLVREQNHFWQLNQLAIQKACGFWLSNLKFLFAERKQFL